MSEAGFSPWCFITVRVPRVDGARAASTALRCETAGKFLLKIATTLVVAAKLGNFALRQPKLGGTTDAEAFVP